MSEPLPNALRHVKNKLFNDRVRNYINFITSIRREKCNQCTVDLRYDHLRKRHRLVRLDLMLTEALDAGDLKEKIDGA